MKNKLLIAIVAILCLSPYWLGAQENPTIVLRKYKSYGEVLEKENRLGIYVNSIKFSGINEGKKSYKITLDIKATVPVNDVMNINLRDEKLHTKFFVLDATSPSDTIPSESKKLMLIATNAPFGTFPMQGFDAIVTVETNQQFVLVCFEGVDNDEYNRFETPPLFFMIELNEKKPKLLDKKPYYLKELIENKK